MKTEWQDEIDMEREEECYKENKRLQECGKPVTDYLQGFQESRTQKDKEELEWLKKTFKDLRKVRTKVAGLSKFQWKINDRIKQIEKELKGINE